MALRAFKATFLVAIDESEARDNEQRDEAEGPVTVEELKDYLRDALVLSWDDEANGNPCGVQSMEVQIEELAELPSAAVHQLYNRE